MDGAAGSTSKAASERQSLVFRDAVRWLIDRIEDPSGKGKVTVDTGGTTRWGISKNAYPNVDIERLTREAAIDLYWRDFWLPIAADALQPVHALVVFDGAVNLGVRQAVELLQKVLRVGVDGKVGPETLGAARMFLPREELVVKYLDARLLFYEDLARKKPEKYGPYIHGWRLRLYRLALEAGRWRGL